MVHLLYCWEKMPLEISDYRNLVNELVQNNLPVTVTIKPIASEVGKLYNFLTKFPNEVVNLIIPTRVVFKWLKYVREFYNIPSDIVQHRHHNYCTSCMKPPYACSGTEYAYLVTDELIGEANDDDKNNSAYLHFLRYDVYCYLCENPLFIVLEAEYKDH